jgi:2'-hydroxyisoflavone reductase
MPRTTTRRQLLRASAAGGAGLLAARALARARPVSAEESERARILILGGTGFLGPAIVDAALARGHGVTLFNRGRTNPGRFPDLETLLGDRDGRLDALAGRTWDAVVDTSGYVPRIVRLSAERLKDAVRHYVFVSTVSVHPGFGESDAAIDENTPVGTLADPSVEKVTGATYGPLKALCEAEAERAFPGRATNVRPGLIVGPGDPTDRFTYWPARLRRGGDVLAPGDGTTEVQVIDVRDLGAWIVHVVEARVFGVYHAVGFDERVSFAELLACAAAAIGTPCTLRWVPEERLLAEGVRPFADLPLWLPKGRLAHVANARARAAGLAFRPLAETAKDTADWVAEGRGDLPWRAGLPAEREAALLASPAGEAAPEAR